MKYRRKNAEVEAVQFTVKTDAYEKTVRHNAADVVRFAEAIDQKYTTVVIGPRSDGFREIFVIDLRTPDGLVRMYNGDWLVRVGGKLEWFTASAFAEEYEAIEEPDFRERVRIEKAELDAKLARLHDFMNTPIFAQQSREDRLLLSRQSESMWLYSLILGERLRGFDAGGEGKVFSSGSLPGKAGSIPAPATNVTERKAQDRLRGVEDC